MTRAEVVRLRAEVAEKEREIERLWNVVCSNPACTAAVIRREDGSRYCSAGHPARWVTVDLLTKTEAEISRLRGVLKIIANGIKGTPIHDHSACAVALDAIRALAEAQVDK